MIKIDCKYIKDTVENREIMTEKFGKITPFSDFSYIEFNHITKIWRTCFMIEWLYCEQPVLSNINDLV